jgi:hypothetical protein
VSKTTRRDFLKDAVLLSGALGPLPLVEGHLIVGDASSSGIGLQKSAVPNRVELSWLGDKVPLVAAGVSWGVPWQRGAVAADQQLTAVAAGRLLPTQTWPLAYWPDGSVKWTGVSVAAEAQLSGPLAVMAGKTAAPEQPVRVREMDKSIEVATGSLICNIGRSGANFIESLSVEGREVARAGRLIVLREDRSAYETSGTIREEAYTSRISKVTVEQSGPVRAVVRIEGSHEGPSSGAGQTRQWLPFSVRLYFTAGVSSVRIVHTFVFDGDQFSDFLRGIGMAFGVPFREELQNRHVRFCSDQEGLFSEPILMSPGYKPAAVAGAVELNRAQMSGKRIPNLSEMTPHDRKSFQDIAVWDAYKLSQLAPDSFSIDKRTNPKSSWLHFTNGRRSRGLVFLGDVSGGLAVGIKRFWEKYPAALEITGASSAAGEMRIWFWAPDAPAMDLRHYDTVGHDINVTYEDYQEGFSTPSGVANTAELTLWATSDTPEAAQLVAMAQTANEPPLLVCTPQHYYDTHTLGIWSLPDRSRPDLASAEDQLDRAFRFYEGEVDRRRWYGFWDYGDFIRTYDPIRHEWMYDVGGHGWNNTELMPNAWLWYAFLRSGRADIFRVAEAMHRNTSEVDVYHSGRFAGLGSRHNVNHWGDGAKEARIDEAFLKRFYYYLTTDERTGDLLREPVGVVEQTLVQVPPLREALPRAVTPVMIRIGPDWLALASNWMAEWERTGNTRYRDYILTGMNDIGAMPEAFVSRGAFRYDPATKHLSDIGAPNMATPDFMVLFGGDQIIMELIQLIDCPPFARAWAMLCDKWAHAGPGSRYSHMRITAYAANFSHDRALENAAIQLFRDSLKFQDGDHFPQKLTVIEGPSVVEPVMETPGNSSFTPAMNTPEAAQWCISIVTATELFKQFSESANR